MFKIAAPQRCFYFLALVCGLGLAPAWGQNSHVLPGWTTGQRPGVVVAGRVISFTSPAVGELDGNSEDGLEVAAVTDDGFVHALRADGTPLWSAALPNANCGNPVGRVGSSPAIGNLFGDSRAFVVIGYGTLFPADDHCGAGVIALRGSDGSVLWNFSTLKYDAKRQRLHGAPGEMMHTVLSTPALADVHGDGQLEIGFGSWDRHVYLLNANGQVLWNYEAADTVWSSPAFYDIDGDGTLEMIIGTDISENTRIKPPTKNGGYLYALQTASPALNTLFTFRSSAAVIWKHWFNQTMFGSPVIAEVMPKTGMEIITPSGYYFPNTGKWLQIVNPLNGRVMRTLKMPAPSASSVAVADLNGDGNNEMVAIINATTEFGGAGPTYLSAWRVDENVMLWQTALSPQTGYYYFNSPVIADLDGNGSLEIIVAHRKRIRIFEGTTGRELTCTTPKCGNPNFGTAAPFLETGAEMHNTPFVADLNNDGILDLVAASGYGPRRGAIYVWTDFARNLHSHPGQNPPFAAPWPAWRVNAQRTGHQ